MNPGCLPRALDQATAKLWSTAADQCRGRDARMDSRPPAHWPVVFSLPFCRLATAYESQTLAAFGEKEHHAAIAVEALSLSNASAS